MTRITFCMALALALGTSTPVNAQLGGGIVYDPSNHAQNVLQAARALQQIEHQVQQLAHEVRMLDNMARELEGLPSSMAGDLEGRLLRLDALMRSAEGLGYHVDRIEDAFDALYPAGQEEALPGMAQRAAQARAHWHQSRSAWRDSLAVTAHIVSTARANMDSLDALMGSSHQAVGNLQALQSGNEIAALQASQLMQLEALMAARTRAEALDRAQMLAVEARARARTRAFLER